MNSRESRPTISSLAVRSHARRYARTRVYTHRKISRVIKSRASEKLMSRNYLSVPSAFSSSSRPLKRGRCAGKAGERGVLAMERRTRERVDIFHENELRLANLPE